MVGVSALPVLARSTLMQSCINSYAQPLEIHVVHVHTSRSSTNTGLFLPELHVAGSWEHTCIAYRHRTGVQYSHSSTMVLRYYNRYL